MPAKVKAAGRKSKQTRDASPSRKKVSFQDDPKPKSTSIKATMDAAKDEAKPIGNKSDPFAQNARILGSFLKLLSTKSSVTTYEAWLNDEKPFLASVVKMFTGKLAIIRQKEYKELSDFPSYPQLARFLTALEHLDTPNQTGIESVQIKRQFKLLRDLTDAVLRHVFDTDRLTRVNIPPKTKWLWQIKVADATEKVLRESYPEQWMQFKLGHVAQDLRNMVAVEVARMPATKNSRTEHLASQGMKQLYAKPEDLEFPEPEEGEVVEIGGIDPEFDDAAHEEIRCLKEPTIPVSELYTEVQIASTP